ncbi:MAG: LysR substrate-binding domain-containing protein [Gammaproteobacteria bacterium]
MKNLPTIKQLRYFITLEQLLHFRKAAEACYVSQSAFSVAIRELESILGAQLADRNNKNVTITSIGKDVAIQARLVLRDLEVLVELTERNQSPLAGRLKLGVIPTITPFLLPQILPRLRKEFPDLKLFLYEDLTQRIYERLMGGDLDLILIAVPYDLRNIETMPLFKDPFYFAYRRGSKLVDPNHYEIEALPSESILLLEDGHCLHDHALSACKISNKSKVSKVTANSLLTLIQMVDADLGVTFLPEMVVKSSLLKNTQVKTLKLPTQNYRELGLIWRQGSARSNEFELLGNFICKQHAAS